MFFPFFKKYVLQIFHLAHSDGKSQFLINQPLISHCKQSGQVFP